MLIENEEIFAIPSRAEHCTVVYAPLRSYVAVTSRENAEALCSGAFAHRDRFIAALKKRPLIQIRQSSEVSAYVPKIQRLAISLSERCNLGCIYCHAFRQGRDPRTLSRPVLTAAITAFCAYSRAPLRFFEFHGDGEPTLQLAAMRHCVEVIEQQQASKAFKSRIALTSNGTFGIEARDFLVSRVDDVTISFDGYQQIQDRHRPRGDGSSCYQQVYENIDALYGSGINLALRVTVTPMSLPRIEEILQFLAASFPGIVVRIEPVQPYGRAAECFPNVSELDAQIASALASSEVLRSEGVRLAGYSDETPTIYDQLRTIGCSMLEFGNWQLASDGIISCCGSSDHPNPLDFWQCASGELAVEELVSAIRNLQERYEVFERNECHECFCKYHCAGGCPILPPDDKGAFCREVRERGRTWLEGKCGIRPSA
jgi:uncharacterized protein